MRMWNLFLPIHHDSWSSTLFLLGSFLLLFKSFTFLDGNILMFVFFIHKSVNLLSSRINGNLLRNRSSILILTSLAWRTWVPEIINIFLYSKSSLTNIFQVRYLKRRVVAPIPEAFLIQILRLFSIFETTSNS